MAVLRSGVSAPRGSKIEEREVGDATAGIALGGLPEHLGYALRRAQLAVFADFIRTLETVHLRPGEYSVLTLIAENPGILARRICAALGIQPANFVTLCGRLEARGIVRRVAIDRRSFGLHLTAKGRTLVERARALSEEHERKIASKIGRAQCRQLVAMLYRVAEIAGEMNPASGDPAPLLKRPVAAPRARRKS